MVDTGKDTSILLGRRWTFSIFTPTRWSLQHHIARYIRGAVEGRPTDLPRASIAKALSRHSQDPVLGRRVQLLLPYMNNPRNVAIQDFNVQDLKFWRWSPDEERFVLYGRNGEIERVVEL